MLRAVLVGLLAVTAAGCNKHDDAPAATVEAAESRPAAPARPRNEQKKPDAIATAYGDKADARKEGRRRPREDDDFRAPIGFGEDMPAFMKIAVRA